MTREELAGRAKEIDKLFYALVQDVIEVTHVWEQRGDEFSHRLYVRTVFAFVEGIVQVMKSAAMLADGLNDPRLLTPEEVTLLKEEDVQIGNAGHIELRKKRISLLPNFQFAFLTYAKARNDTVALDKGGEGWQCFREAVKIRDRLTHPHTVKDLEVPEKDLETVEKAMEFFRDSTGQLLHK